MNRRQAQSGQAMVLIAALMSVMIMISALVLDISHDYTTQRDVQTAADMAALSAGYALQQSHALNLPPAVDSLPIKVAHDFVAQNGFSTVYSTSSPQCQNHTSTSFLATFTDVGACNAASGYHTKVTIQAPAVSISGFPDPPAQCGDTSTQYECLQVMVDVVMPHYFAGYFGIGSAHATAVSTVFAQPTTSTLSVDLPQLYALYLYQPQNGCETQCYDQSKVAHRNYLSCKTAVDAANDCPTFWARQSTAPYIIGADGAAYVVPGDYPVLQSAGDMVAQDQTTFCDPYNSATCTKNTVVGANGFAINSGNTYCTAIQGSHTNTCQTGAYGGAINKIWANQTTFNSQTWCPTNPTDGTCGEDLTGLPSCGALILNGNTVANSFSTATLAGHTTPVTPAAACSPPASSGYTIEPGIYSYIVINHGTYEFAPGIYDITDEAPVNTLTGAGYLANGVDHSKETAADFDLCNQGGLQPNSCSGGATGPVVSAGVWIGHGGGGFGAFYAGTTGSCTGGAGSTDSGGGDATVVSGTGVTFRLENSAAGFVSTDETITNLSSPGLGAKKNVDYLPLLFDEEGNDFIHLGGSSHNPNVSGFSGIVYQVNGDGDNYAGGGVEIDPGMGGTTHSALTGNVLARTFTTFGHSGTAINFATGFGAGSPSISTSGNAEPSVITSTAYGQVTPGNPSSNLYFQLNYSDEWALDAYDVYISVNNGTPVFFSQGVWNVSPVTNPPPNPNGSGPSDTTSPTNQTQRPDGTSGGAPSGYTQALDPISGTYTDYTYAIPSSGGSSIEVYGDWTWGHESNITGATSGTNNAVVKYIFPPPSGSAISITVFLTDGDHCGDYAKSTYSFANLGAGTTAGSVTLVQ